MIVTKPEKLDNIKVGDIIFFFFQNCLPDVPAKHPNQN
jgi:hypothetical protein